MTMFNHKQTLQERINFEASRLNKIKQKLRDTKREYDNTVSRIIHLEKLLENEKEKNLEV